MTKSLAVPQFARRRGRPPMPDRMRDARGRSRGESPAEIVATARAQRIKAGADPADALNPLWGTALGILHRRWQLRPTDPAGVSGDQFNAAQAYIATLFHHAEIMGLPMPWPGDAGSRPTRADPAEDVVLAVRRRFADLRRTLLDCGRALGLGARVNAAVYRGCIEDPPLAAVAPAEIANLRYGLNAIARWLR